MFCAVLLAGCAWCAAYDPAAAAGFFPRCQLYAVTGLFCPGCGASRAVHALLRGNLALALAYNPLLVAAAPLLAGWGALLAVCAVAGWRLALPLRAWVAGAALIVLLAFGVARNLPSSACARLRPPAEPPPRSRQAPGPGAVGAGVAQSRGSD